MHEEVQGVEYLRELGLNQLEAEVYVFLLPHEPMTAYRVGQAMGKPTANVYKAVESLARRGAVLVEEGENRLCRAVPAREFLRRTQDRIAETTRRAEEALASLHRPSVDERVYKIEATADALSRASEMLDRCTTVAVVDAFPRALAAIAPAIRRAVDRGLPVHVQAYAPVDLPGARIAVASPGEASVQAWGSEQLNVVIDGKEVLLALVSEDLGQVYQALWTRSLYLSCLVHAGLLAEHTLHRLVAAHALPDGPGLATMLHEHPFFATSDVPGHRELLARFLAPRPPKENP